MDCLTTVRRRRAIRLLSDRSSPITERQLARRLAAVARGVDSGAVPEDVVREVHLGLCHGDLPKLAAAGLASWDRSAETVAPTDHPVLEDDRFQTLLDEADDAVVEAIASESSRAVLATLHDVDGALETDELARRVAGGATDGDRLERTKITLHHTVLPRLVDAGLIARDDDGTVRYTGPASLPGVAGPDSPVPGTDAAADDEPGGSGGDPGSEVRIP